MRHVCLRGKRLVAGAAAVVVLLLAGEDPNSAGPLTVVASDPPNIVLITADGVRAGELRELPRTQRLLVEQGVRFTSTISADRIDAFARRLARAGHLVVTEGQFLEAHRSRRPFFAWIDDVTLPSVDDAVDRTIRRLRQTRELADTFVVLTGDGPTGPDGRVPLVIRGPGLPRGSVEAAPVTLRDLVPMLLRKPRSTS